MIQEERVKQMTKLAIYEDGEGKKYIPMTRFFRRDYIGWEMVKSFVFGTLAFLLVCGVYIVYQINSMINDLFDLDYLTIGKDVLTIYIIFMVLYLLLTYVIYSLRYKTGRKHIKKFYNQLKKVSKLYDQEERGRSKQDWE